MSNAPIRVLAGPNRGGKTTAGAYELVSFATGYNQFRDETYQTPNISWAIALDHMNMGGVQRRAVFSMLPRGFKYYKMESRVVLPAPWKSEIVFKSADSGREKFQGEGLQAAWFDEEPIGLEGHEIFKEVYARRKPGVPLRIFLTFTPLQGLSWAYDYLWDKRSKVRLKGVDTFSFDIFQCAIDQGGFLSQEEIDTIVAGYSENERKARVYGQFTMMGGSPFFSPEFMDQKLKLAEPYKSYQITTSPGVLPSITTLRLQEKDDGALKIVRQPLRGHRYTIGVDVGSGSGKDYTVASVWDDEDLVESAFWQDNEVDPEAFTRNSLVPLGLLYNNAKIAVETNGEHGGISNSTLAISKYKNVYMRQNWDSIHREIRMKYGWKTDPATRGFLLDTLSMMLRDPKWLPSAQLIREMAFFINILKPNGKYFAEAMSGRNDDHVIAAAIALTIISQTPKYAAPNLDWAVPKYRMQEGDWMSY
jgi:phage terminase large subunit-like protein